MSAKADEDKRLELGKHTTEEGYHYYYVIWGERSLTWGEVLGLLQSDRDFPLQYTDKLLNIHGRGEAFFWECAPISFAELDTTLFCFVAVRTPAFQGLRCDPKSFSDHFQANKLRHSVIKFPNLSGDANLVVPSDHLPETDCTHIQVFLESAEKDIIVQFWSEVAKSTLSFFEESSSLKRAGPRTKDSPVWLSTSGLGVYFLHVRISIAPKYYSFVPFLDHPFDYPDVPHAPDVHPAPPVPHAPAVHPAPPVPPVPPVPPPPFEPVRRPGCYCFLL